jgi:hypothetical protein
LTQNYVRQAARRPYVSPRLTVYGDVRDLTLSSRTNNKNDPGNTAQLMT